MNQPEQKQDPDDALRTDLGQLRNKRLLLITGKGGVGRTTVAAVLARLCARAGKRVLLLEMGESEEDFSPLARFFGKDRLTAELQQLGPNLKGGLLLAGVGHRLFLEKVLRMPILVRAALRSKALRRFLDAVPSFHEAGLFQHMLGYMQAKNAAGEHEHEVVIIDMPATGHTLALTKLPEILLKLIPGGPITRELRAGLSYVNDAEQSAAWVVTLPEVLPVSEALELIEGLDETATPIGGVVLNRFPADRFSPTERAALDPLLASKPVFGALAYHRIAGAERALERLQRNTSLPLVLVREHSRKKGDLVETILGDLLRREAAS